jgi:hypothetical protein
MHFLMDPKVSPGYQTTHTDGSFSSEMFTCSGKTATVTYWTTTCSGKTATVSYWTTTGACIGTPNFKDIPLNNCIPVRLKESGQAAERARAALFQAALVPN